jgi:hypothetical protein
MRAKNSEVARLASDLDLESDFEPGARDTLRDRSRHSPRGPAGRAGGGDYRPYAVDWRFLPDDVLLAKDFIRYHLVQANNVAAASPALRPLWVKTLGRRTLEAIRSAEIVFIHVPKTGGTSISRFLYNRNLPHYTAEFAYRTFGASIRAYRSFAIVRHPTERLVSAYKMALFGGTDIVAYSRYWRSRLRGLGAFETFVDFVAESRLRGAALPEELHDQASFILDSEGLVMVDRLFSLDAHRGLSPDLCRWLRMPPPPRLNVTRPHPVTVTADLQAKIAGIYRRDFAIYDHLLGQGGGADARGLRLPPA